MSDKKFVPFNISSTLWSDFSIKLAKNSKKLLQSNSKLKQRSLSKSRVLNNLLKSFLDGKIEIDNFSSNGAPKDNKLKGIFVDVEVWQQARNLITEKATLNEDIKGGLGGIIVKLVEFYQDHDL